MEIHLSFITDFYHELLKVKATNNVIIPRVGEYVQIPSEGRVIVLSITYEYHTNYTKVECIVSHR